MVESQTCPKCGVAELSSTVETHCVGCALKLGLELTDELDEDIAACGDLLSPTESCSRIGECSGDRIGRYTLIEQIGEGGCGVIYLAEQSDPVRRQVALKILKLGMDTRQVVARFAVERQALALLEHPNISKFFDGGATVSGRPYFVMELVRGFRITDYCDERKLSIRQRLALFLDVCQAVQHAHHKGVIHRDLKPSNILVCEVERKPVPKVIDFGIAKATANLPLGDHTHFTAIQQFIGTPAYMSPEQAGLRGEDIDTRSDVYSLGVLLYELLTGQLPFDLQGAKHLAPDELLRSIREKEPPRPSAALAALPRADLKKAAAERQTEPSRLPKTFRSELDWVVMKALEKDRKARYQTVLDLAADVERFLALKPISAHPPSLGRRVQNILIRNRRRLSDYGVAVVFIVTIAVLAFLRYRYEQTYRQALAAERTQKQLRRDAKLMPNVIKTYDAEREYSPTKNPNAPWSYGWSREIEDPIILYSSGLKNVESELWSTGPVPQVWPCVVHLRPKTIEVDEPRDSMFLYPGPNSECSRLAWAAPTQGAYVIRAGFVLMEGGSSSVTVTARDRTRVNIMWSQQLLPATPIGVFVITNYVKQGETFDFAVNWGDTGRLVGSGTAVSAVIQQVSKPHLAEATDFSPLRSVPLAPAVPPSGPDGLESLFSFDGLHGACPASGLSQAPDGALYGVTGAGGEADFGTVFKFSSLVYRLYVFTNGIDGATPNGPLLRLPDGAFYGTTAGGGAAGRGVLFQIRPRQYLAASTVRSLKDNADFVPLRSFLGGGDGANPSGGLILGKDGLMYGATAKGGSNNMGALFRATTNGIVTPFFSFAGSDGSQPNGPLLLGPDGNFYGTTYGGGSHSLGTVYVITPSGEHWMLYSCDGAKQGSHPRAGLALYPNGNIAGTAAQGAYGFGAVFQLYPPFSVPLINGDGAFPGAAVLPFNERLYTVTEQGGAFNKGTLVEISALGKTKVLHHFTGGNDGGNPLGSLTFGADGCLYGTTSRGGAHDKGTIFRYHFEGRSQTNEQHAAANY